MSSYSPYAVAESEPPQWKPGEELAAAAFIGITLYLMLDVNVGIWRLFKKTQGLYYWTMKLGTLAVGVDAIGVIIKYLVPNSGYIWPLYTTFMLVGWSIYAPAQLLVLYSRLHLINQGYQIQRWVLIMILSTLFCLVLPTWIVVWPGYDIDPKVSSLWSPREAIVERYTQIGFTLVECVLSGVYVWPLLGLLSLKATVRQRQVMLDIIYVNVVIVASEIAVVILVYLNQLGISHPLQAFSYALKLKLEFVVLNQLMAVAARGLKKESFEERRYHHPSTGGNFSAECRQWDDKSLVIPAKQSQTQSGDGTSSSMGSTQITVPSPVLPKSHHTPADSVSGRDACDQTLKERQGSSESTKRGKADDHLEFDNEIFGGEPDLSIKSLSEDRTSGKKDTETIREHPSQALSGETLQPSATSPRGESLELYPRPVRELMHHGPQSTQGRPAGHGVGDSGKKNMNPKEGTIKRRFPRKRKDNVIEEEEEEIGVHMWEKGGKLVMEVPWFKTRTGI
ncbi:hypothetical protein OEA41_005279 [Lepraria neglecta]|uniref:DUF7703 domain-containing protein n=1 Tax=Lepraria neglecta TaxID=209136 RepID=A0AAD9Z0T2_9LECA|nr:hypothetical protein OEA41_005279 [Lepraria neglecta]